MWPHKTWHVPAFCDWPSEQSPSVILKRPGVPRLYSVGAPPVQNIFGIRHKVFCLLVRKGEKRSKVQKVGDLSLSSRDVSIIGRACQARLFIVRLELYGIHDISSSVLTLPFSSSNKIVSSLSFEMFSKWHFWSWAHFSGHIIQPGLLFGGKKAFYLQSFTRLHCCCFGCFLDYCSFGK